MNRDDILELPAGPEMDALIAKEVMGYKVDGLVVLFPDGDYSYLIPDPGGHWSPSQDINIAWEIVEKLRLTITQKELSLFPKEYERSRWLVDNKLKAGHELWLAYGDTAPLAICRAALLVVIEGKQIGS